MYYLRRVVIEQIIYHMLREIGEYVRAREIFLITLLFVLCFILTEIIISHFNVSGIFKRFILRMMFLVQYSIFINFLFDSSDDNVGKMKKK